MAIIIVMMLIIMVIMVIIMVIMVIIMVIIIVTIMDIAVLKKVLILQDKAVEWLMLNALEHMEPHNILLHLLIEKLA
jgi:hypothetical protein